MVAFWTMMRGEERNGRLRSTALPRAKRDSLARWVAFVHLVQQSNCYRDQQLVVQISSKASGTASKKPRNEGLPDWVDAQWFRYAFVTTYMAFVGQTANPWDVPVKQSVLVMQKIWDATSVHQYEITMATSIYQKVCD
jgi:hypothetical protein